MELRHLRYYVAVAEEENVSRAALRLHVSQPALSRQIRDLEEEIGFDLLERSAKSVSLTDAGRVFLKEACAVLQRAEAAVEKARAVAAGGAGELHVGYAPSLTAQILPRTLRAFQAEAPRVRVFLHDLSTEQMLSRLRDGTLQVAFLVKPTRAMLRDLIYEEVEQSPLCVAVATGHPLAKKSSVTLDRLIKEPLAGYDRKEYPEYHELLAELFSGSSGKWRVVEEHDSVTSLIAAVEAGNGVAIVPDVLNCIAGQRLTLVPIKPEPPRLSIGAVWAKQGLLPMAEKFLSLARKSKL